MAILSCCCQSSTKPQKILASSLPNDSSSSLPPTSSQFKPNKPNKIKLEQKQGQQQPSILEIERAIGAGIFRDRDTLEEEKSSTRTSTSTSLFDNIMRNSVGKNEGSVEKKLRESGEWLIHQTESTSHSAGKQILMAMFLWIIPIWIAAFIVASGIVHLPFLDDLVS